MPLLWDQAELQRYIDEGIEESLTLDYKAADALGNSDGKKREITKDVTAMANSAGGIIVYGIREFDDPENRHKPERFDGIDRTQFSKERLEHIINSVQPRINGIVINPVELGTASNHVAYVVEIPQSTTAHQAKDLRYYRRFNFESIAMYDYEIRDVMNRATTTDVEAAFSTTPVLERGIDRRYRLNVTIKNLGGRVVEKYKLLFTFPDLDSEITYRPHPTTDVPHVGFCQVVKNPASREHDVEFKSREILFPKEELDVGSLINLEFSIETRVRHYLLKTKSTGSELVLRWTLYADDMPQKNGIIPFSSLCDY